MTLREWADENGSYGACRCCGARIWIESACEPLCGACAAHEDAGEDHPQERDTLANLGLSESDFR